MTTRAKEKEKEKEKGKAKKTPLDGHFDLEKLEEFATPEAYPDSQWYISIGDEGDPLAEMQIYTIENKKTNYMMRVDNIRAQAFDTGATVAFAFGEYADGTPLYAAFDMHRFNPKYIRDFQGSYGDLVDKVKLFVEKKQYTKVVAALTTFHEKHHAEYLEESLLKMQEQLIDKRDNPGGKPQQSLSLAGGHDEDNAPDIVSTEAGRAPKTLKVKMNGHTPSSGGGRSSTLSGSDHAPPQLVKETRPQPPEKGAGRAEAKGGAAGKQGVGRGRGQKRCQPSPSVSLSPSPEPLQRVRVPRKPRGFGRAAPTFSMTPSMDNEEPEISEDSLDPSPSEGLPSGGRGQEKRQRRPVDAPLLERMPKKAPATMKPNTFAADFESTSKAECKNKTVRMLIENAPHGTNTMSIDIRQIYEPSRERTGDLPPYQISMASNTR